MFIEIEAVVVIIEKQPVQSPLNQFPLDEAFRINITIFLLKTIKEYYAAQASRNV